MVVVQGATSARRSRGIAASRDRTTTGRRPISANSHHHTSPRAGSALTRRRLLARPDETARAFTDDGWYRSGDLAYADRDGYLYIVDCMKDMIITRLRAATEPMRCGASHRWSS